MTSELSPELRMKKALEEWILHHRKWKIGVMAAMEAGVQACKAIEEYKRAAKRAKEFGGK